MKQILFYLFFTFFSYSTYCQESREILTDSSMVIGKLKEAVRIGTYINNYCMLEDRKYMHDERVVIIKGLKKCYSNSPTPLVEIIINNKEYLIEPNDIEIFKDDFLTKFDSFTYSQKEKFRLQAKFTGEVLYNSKLDEILKFSNSCSPKGLCVLEWTIYDESEHTDGTNFKIKVLNPTKKTIKYLWFTLVGFNPVGDKVFDRIKQTSSCTVKAVGPIEALETGSYEFEYVWFTDLVETAKITQIKVQYMDGSIKLITNVDSITLKTELQSVLDTEE